MNSAYQAHSLQRYPLHYRHLLNNDFIKTFNGRIPEEMGRTGDLKKTRNSVPKHCWNLQEYLEHSWKAEEIYCSWDFRGDHVTTSVNNLQKWMNISMYTSENKKRLTHKISKTVLRKGYLSRATLLLMFTVHNNGVMVKAMHCGIVVSEFELQSRYYNHFQTNTLGKGITPLSSKLCVK